MTPAIVYLVYAVLVGVAASLANKPRGDWDSGVGDLAGYIGAALFVAGLMGLAVVG